MEEAYKKETEKENEKKFSCIRRSVMPACYFPILYQHFFIKDDSKYANIQAVNKFLYRALKLEDNDKFCTFVSENLSIGLRREVEKFKNCHVNTGVASKLKFSKEDEKLGDIRDKLEEVLGNLYDTGSETWKMYGIFICQDKQNLEKYEFYYDPINEAVADAECKIIDGNEKQVIRTGHWTFDDGDRIDPDDETSSLTIEVLNEKIGIYQFYFDKGETLRNLIRK